MESDALNNLERKRDVVKTDKELPEGLKKSKALLDALTNDDETPGL